MERLKLRTMEEAVRHVGQDDIHALRWECVQGNVGTYESLEFIYQGCGVLEPLQLTSGRYIRRSCNCERKARKDYDVQCEQWMWLRQNREKAYGWLGSRWSDTALSEKTFKNFTRERQETAYDAARMFVSLLKGTFILHGTYGTGKTHLLAAICNELLQQQISPRFTTAPKLFSAIQWCIGNNQEYTNLVREAIRTPLLVIDDIDKARHSEFREEIYFEILDQRANNGRPTAISTNRLSDLDQFVGGAVQSRLSIGQIAIEMAGADYRLEL